MLGLAYVHIFYWLRGFNAESNENAVGGPWAVVVRALVARALIGPLGPRGPGPYGPGPYGPPWDIMGPALVGFPGPLWAGPYWTSLGPYGSGPYGPDPHGPLGLLFCYFSPGLMVQTN